MRSTLTLTALALSLAAGSAVASDLLVTGESGVINTIDLTTGEVGSLPGVTEAVLSTAVHAGKLYMGTFDSEIVVFDLDTNTIDTRFALPEDATAIAWDGFNLAAGTASGSVYYINHETGEIVDSIDNVGTDITAIGVDAGGLFVGGQSTLAMRSHIGQTNFQFFAACGSMINSMAFGPQTMYLGGTAFFGADAGTIYKFDKFVGGVNYSGTFGVSNDASATLEFNGMLYVGGSDGTLLEVDPGTGEVFRQFAVGPAVHGITPTNGIVACPADYDISGQLDVFDVFTFLELFNAQLPAGDTNGDSTFDIFDVTTFLDRYNAGCE
ncbi:MAG: hypothetical protein KC996_08405 [Phycisphaerales bacterium]|nr:hypothetical protein [Phycisphaerales bacterium]